MEPDFTQDLKDKYGFMRNAELNFDPVLNSAIELFCMEIDATSRATLSAAVVKSIKTVEGKTTFDVEGDKFIKSIAARYDEMINGPLALGLDAIKQREDEFEDE